MQKIATRTARTSLIISARSKENSYGVLTPKASTVKSQNGGRLKFKLRKSTLRKLSGCKYKTERANEILVTHCSLDVLSNPLKLNLLRGENLRR